MTSSVERFRWNSSDGTSSVKEDSASKLGSDEETDLGDVDMCKSSLRDTSFYFEGVLFSPRVIEFIDAFEGKQFSVKIKIQNVGKKPVLVRIGEPNSFIFQLKKPSRRVKFLASGSSLTKTITYSYHNDDIVQRSQIPVQINGHFVDYPIVVKKAQTEIAVEPTQLDFKQINLGALAKTVLLTIHNSGGRRTKFEIDLGKNDLDLVVNPVRGTIKAKSKVTVVVEMMGMSEGEYFKELWVTTNEMSMRVPVLVEVVRPRLEIIHPNVTEDFVLIDFPPTFVKTQRAELFLLKNYSADTTLFITLAEIGGDLKFLQDARKVHDTCKVFRFTNEEGRLEPFECRVVTALFLPNGSTPKRGWKRIENKKKKKGSRVEHIVFVRIIRVHCIEIQQIARGETRPTFNTVKERNSSMDHSSVSLQPGFTGLSKNVRTSHYVSEILEIDPVIRKSSGFLMSSSSDERVLRVCLHGTAVEPIILVQPSSLEFEPLGIGQTGKKVLRVKNDSVLPIKYKFHDLMNAVVSNGEGWLDPDCAFEFLVSITPTCAGKFNTKIHIEILGRSDVVFEDDKDLVTIANLFVPVSYVANTVPVTIQPRINLGITPTMLDEVGFLKEKATFKSDCPKPQAAMLSSLKKSTKPEWMKMEPDKVGKVDNAIVAFPNDRPRLYYTWPKEHICRTIFKGIFRYSPPEDSSYTLTAEEAEIKKRHNLFWNDYLKLLRNWRQQAILQMKEKSKSLSAEDSKHGPSLPKYIMENESNEWMQKKEVFPQHDLVPLSPQHLNNINVEPKLINFGTVAVNDLVYETLTVLNMNSFPVGIRFVPGKTAVKVLEGKTIVVEPYASKSLSVSFQTKDLGRHYGFLNYVINSSHQFKISISAYVTSKTLILEDKNLVIEFGTHPAESAFQPRSTFLELKNILQSPINYRWELPADSSFITDITEGQVPPRTELLTEIKLAMQPGKSFYSEFNLISESGSSELIKLIYPHKKVSVRFLNNRIDTRDIPLNLPTKVTAVLQNACYHDVVFEVFNWNPMPGVFVEPRCGVLKPRSYFPLKITIQIPVVMKFSFEIIVFVHIMQKMNVKVTGNVVVPLIRIKPSEVVMRKICSQSFDIATLCIENAGTTPAEIDIDFRECPEYKVIDEKSNIFLLPSKVAKVRICFQPMDVARYVFYFPIIINKILGPPMMQEPNTDHLKYYISGFESIYEDYGKVFRSENSKLRIPCVCINSTVTPGLLVISCLKVNFRPTGDMSSEFQSQSITISNDFVESVTFCIRNDDLGEVNESPFDLKPADPEAIEYRSKSMKADLRQGEKLVFSATFAPKKPGNYKVEIPIYVRGYNNGVVYNYITLTGEWKQPKLYPNAKEVHFPPLPLDVGCDVVISILAENYQSSDTITCLICDSLDEGDLSLKQLSIAWLNEPKINRSFSKAQVFQVLITFCSPIPVALRSYLVFVDSAGNYCTVLVTAIADNSVVTTHAFLVTRAAKYKLVADVSSVNPLISFTSVNLLNKYDGKSSKVQKKGNGRKSLGFQKSGSPKADPTNNASALPIEKGSRLVVHLTKSMTRLTQLSFVNTNKKPSPAKIKERSSTLLTSIKSRILNSISRSDSYSGFLSIEPPCKETEVTIDVTHPYFPTKSNTLYGKHFQQTLVYLERWMFEVVMQCDQYFTIPKSFQKLRINETAKSSSKFKKPSLKAKANAGADKIEKDFLDFLLEVLGSDSRGLVSNRSLFEGENRVLSLYNFYSYILQFLTSKGCLLPHIKPEHLFNYEDYILFVTDHSQCMTEKFIWIRDRSQPTKSVKEMASSNPRVNLDLSSTSIFARGTSWGKSLFENAKAESEGNVNANANTNDEEEEEDEPEKENLRNQSEDNEFVHRVEVLDNVTLETKSTQAWLDIIVQVFRTLVLTEICHITMIPETELVGPEESLCVDVALKSQTQWQVCDVPLSPSLDNNVYTIQERTLLTWLNYHYNEWREFFSKNLNGDDFFLGPRVVNNFDKDLSDSVVLIVVTTAYCPYIFFEYFSDVFFKPDTPNKMYHNAGKLALVWKVLNVGLTVESMDIVNPNPLFMVLLVTQLYKVLPTLHPHYKINFSAPLSSEITRSICIKNEHEKAVHYKVFFMGEYEKSFRLKTSLNLITVKPRKTTEIQVIFTARKIKKITATLVLCGSVISPNFAQNFSFHLEGEPSSLRESCRLSFTTPLYKVLCTEIPVSPPYPEATTYEIWYTTNEPVYKENADISLYVKPWCKIWNRKVSRRLFLNKCELTVNANTEPVPLGVAVACMTEKERNFWLLFRNGKVGDFLILVNIKANTKVPLLVINEFFRHPNTTSTECLCLARNKKLIPNDSNPSGCPFLTELCIPVRNDQLWESMKNMFLRTLHSKEKSFWSLHFEKNIGLCLILWFLSVEEEEDVADEFIHFLQTRVLYNLKVEPPHDQYLQIPEKIEIPDVRKKTGIRLPIHISKNAPQKIKATLTMTSENGKETRKYRINLTALSSMGKKSDMLEEEAGD